jgi:hypothetical protein
VTEAEVETEKRVAELISAIRHRVDPDEAADRAVAMAGGFKGETFGLLVLSTAVMLAALSFEAPEDEYQPIDVVCGVVTNLAIDIARKYERKHASH